MSLRTAHDEIERREPELPRRLYAPFPWDRQAEHAPDDSKVAHQPVFEPAASGLRCRYNQGLIENADGLTGTALDDGGREALAAMSAVLNSPAQWLEFTIEKGQLQYLNN